MKRLILPVIMLLLIAGAAYFFLNRESPDEIETRKNTEAILEVDKMALTYAAEELNFSERLEYMAEGIGECWDEKQGSGSKRVCELYHDTMYGTNQSAEELKKAVADTFKKQEWKQKDSRDLTFTRDKMTATVTFTSPEEAIKEGNECDGFCEEIKNLKDKYSLYYRLYLVNTN